MKSFPDQLFQLLDEHADVMYFETRKVIVQSLILMRNRGLIEVVPLLKKLFTYFRINDKHLRALIFTHIISDISACNEKKANEVVFAKIHELMLR